MVSDWHKKDVKPSQRRSFTRDEIAFAYAQFDTVKHAARFLGVSATRFSVLLSLYEIPRKPYKKPASFSMYTAVETGEK